MNEGQLVTFQYVNLMELLRAWAGNLSRCIDANMRFKAPALKYRRRRAVRPFSGFSMAELLIALLIVAELATFAIPKVLHSQEESRKKAVFREILAGIEQQVYLGVTTKKIYWTGTGYNGSYVGDSLNAIKVCKGGTAEALGCWDASAGTMGYSTFNGAWSYVFSNGAVLIGRGITSNDGGNSFMYLDWNGTLSPNQVGEDQIGVFACYDTTDCNVWGVVKRPGTIGPVVFSAPTNSDSRPLWDWIWSR
ncbi:MAG TPA: type II secretion system protein [Coleofasciculaceae cyanobacterium]|jgi:type II secretory pathway pseudopilin PulG